jgi:hypothetical protein
MVEYIEETPPTTLVGNICNEIQVHSHMHRLWGSLIYMVVLLTSHTFVVFDVSAIILVLSIHYINPLKEIVINYQRGA